MADFQQALDHLLDLEGYPGYVDDPHDHGGETFAGISRRYWPNWPGWTLVGTLKESAEAKRRMTENRQLRQMVSVFYRQHFWTRYLERMAHQDLAEWVFQMGVNCGLKQPVKFLQRALCIVDDGMFGRYTEDALRRADPSVILHSCRQEARKFYLALAAKDDSQTRFLRGWLNRANA